MNVLNTSAQNNCNIEANVVNIKNYVKLESDSQTNKENLDIDYLDKIISDNTHKIINNVNQCDSKNENNENIINPKYNIEENYLNENKINNNSNF